MKFITSKHYNIENLKLRNIQLETQAQNRWTMTRLMLQINIEDFMKP